MHFTRRYGEISYQSARSGLSLFNLTSPVEVEDMIQKSRIQLESLTKIRDVILSEQAAYEEQLADQRHKAFAEPPPPALRVKGFHDARIRHRRSSSVGQQPCRPRHQRG